MNKSEQDETQPAHPALNREPKQSVLVVDDSDALRELFSRVFQRTGYSVKSASNGLVAMEMLLNREIVPDVVILDIDMPYMDGFSVMNFIHSQLELANTKIIVVTGNDVAAFSSHVDKADLWLVKPVSVAELVRLAGRFMMATAS
jgi:CheY-like chemotaxis protein